MKKVVLLVLFFVFLPVVSSAETITISRPIFSDTIWSASNVYIVDAGFSVSAGATLTIEPGTVIKMKNFGYWTPDIFGKLIATGTKEAPIYFTSFYTDGYNRWQGLYFKPGSEGDFDYVDISYAGAGGYGTGDYVGIENDGGFLDIKHSNIHDNYIITSNGAGGSWSVGSGVYNKSGTLSVTNSVIDNNVWGIRVDSGTTTISDNFIKNNVDITGYGPGYGVYAEGPEPLTLLNNTFSGNRRTAHVGASKKFTHSGNTSEDIINRGFEMGGIISNDTTFKSGDLPYIIQGLTISNGKILTLEPGTILKMNDYYSSGAIYVQGGNLIAKGTPEKKIYITSLKNDSVGGDTNGDGTASTPSPKNWGSVILENGSRAEFDNVVVSYGGYNANGEYLNIAAVIYQRGAQFSVTNSLFEHNAITDIFQDAGTTNITNSQLTDGNYGIWSRGGNITISQSSLTNHTGLAIYNESGSVIDAKNNWWGDPSGPNNIYDPNPTGTGDKISSNVDYVPFLTEPPGTTATCCSSVLFLPGLEASRLYKQGLLGEDRLWEPNINSDVVDLYLNQEGRSINNVYTKDVVNKALGISPIYDSFIKEMDQLVVDNKIKEWKPYAYDWRQDVEDVVNNGTKYKDGQKSLITILEELMNSSVTGKVTIVAHSNGGLLAKAFLAKLEELKNAGTNNLIDKIDNVVLVASPQIGTPVSIGAILHGYGQALDPIGFLLGTQTARQLALNMPSGYGLLPSQKYYQISTTPIISFDSNSSLAQTYRNYYGNEVNSFTEQNDFIVGKEGRTNPDISNTILPIVGNESLLNKSQELHSKIDNLVIPSNIKLIQLAGWGKDTLVGMKYVEKTICDPVVLLNICIPKKILDLRPITDMNGDKTVVAPSALYDDQGDKYWLDLSSSKIEHKNIFENTSVLQFLEKIITKNPLATDRIYKLRPTYTKTRDKISVHSPVTLGAYDQLGNFTGKICDLNSDFCRIVEDIPNSSYMEFGEGKYLNADEENINKAVLQGTDIGTFTYESEKVTPDNTSTITKFIDIPITSQTTAEITTNPNTKIQELKLDTNSDGTTDITIQPSSTFDPIVYLQVMRKNIENLDITKARKNGFLNRIDNTIKAIQKGKIDKAKLKVERFTSILERRIDKKDPKKPRPHQLTKTDAEQLLLMLDTLLNNLN